MKLQTREIGRQLSFSFTPEQATVVTAFFVFVCSGNTCLRRFRY